MTAGWAVELSAGADPDLVARAMRLAATEWVSPERIRRAVAHCMDTPCADAPDVMAAVESQADATHQLASRRDTETAARRLLELGAVVSVVGTPGYPSRLADAWPELGAPLWFFLLARRPQLPGGPAAAIVGTRHPTLDGTRTARELGALLAKAGVTVISGMARGIDQAGHMGALDAGGVTVGVLGTGFGVDYPRRDGPLRDAIVASGGLVSELLPGTPPMRRAFLWRNRIISGLSDVTVVVEGRSGSGALQTARLAASQGREVLAVPGPVRAPTSRAPLDLIRDGAQPVTRLEDVLEVLQVSVPAGAGDQGPAPASVDGLSEVAVQLLPLLGAVPATPGTLAAATRRPVPAVMAAVGELAGRGIAAMTPRGVVRSGPQT